MVKCKECNIELTDENWYPTSQRKHYYICKKCLYLKTKPLIYNWRKENPQEWKNIQKKSNIKNKNIKRDWSRKHCLSGTSSAELNKRDYPKDNICELCKKFKKKLDYHHWDDNKLDMGMWICSPCCHKFAELIDEFGINIVNEYLKLKENIEKEYLERMVTKK